MILLKNAFNIYLLNILYCFLVAGILKPLQMLGQWNSSNNLNDLNYGIVWGNGIANAPTSDSRYIVFSLSDGVTMIWQMAKAFAGNTLHIRNWNNTQGWSSWQTITPV